ncbi:hypothetical protein K432DRAFT_313566, partial [Lepidopterella palustris CBS 459.81]
SPLARAAIVSKTEAGYPARKLADEYGVTRQCINATLRRWKKHKTTTSLPRSGRLPILSRRQKRLLYQAARQNPKIEYQKLWEKAGLLEHPHPPSRSTMYRSLKKDGLTNHRCKKRPKMNAGHAKHRLKFCRQHRHFNWKRRTVKFSDECSVELGSGANAEWCFRYPEEKWNPNMI